MSLFKSYVLTGEVYHPDDVNSTKKTNYPSVADFSIKLHIQKMGMTDAILLADIYGNYYAHSNDSRASEVTKGDKIKIGTDEYYISDVPRYITLFKRYRYTMKQ